MKEAIVWTACLRPEYAKASLESIFQAKERPDFFAYVDKAPNGADEEIIKLLQQYPCTKITHREQNYMISKNYLLGLKEVADLGYEVFHGFEEDLIISTDYFLRCREALKDPSVFVFFSLLTYPNQAGRKDHGYCPWGPSMKIDLYRLIEPYILPFLDALSKGKVASMNYQKEQFGFGTHAECDGLINNITNKYKTIGIYPERSYSKDIGAFGYHRLKGAIPIKTLAEWAEEPLTNQPGYGIQGIGFKM